MCIVLVESSVMQPETLLIFRKAYTGLVRIKPHVPVQCASSEARMSACRAAQVVSRAPESCAWVTVALMTEHSGPPAPEN